MKCQCAHPIIVTGLKRLAQKRKRERKGSLTNTLKASPPWADQSRIVLSLDPVAINLPGPSVFWKMGQTRKAGTLPSSVSVLARRGRDMQR
jgi:hypothetical protein